MTQQTMDVVETMMVDLPGAETISAEVFRDGGGDDISGPVAEVRVRVLAEAGAVYIDLPGGDGQFLSLSLADLLVAIAEGTRREAG